MTIKFEHKSGDSPVVLGPEYFDKLKAWIARRALEEKQEREFRAHYPEHPNC